MLTQARKNKNYVLPAGIIVFANTWAIHHDENGYSKPCKFNPDRWLSNKYDTTTDDTACYESGQRKLT